MTRVLTCLAVLATLAGTHVARADGGGEGEIGESLTVNVPDPSDPKQKGQAPTIEATIVNGPKLPFDKFSISTIGADKQKVTIKADKLRDYVEGKETIAIALVINGQEIWVGNEEVEQDPQSQFPGALKDLEGAIDKMGLPNAGPPGSKGVLISYSNGAEVKVAMTDLKNINGAALGNERDYYHKLGTDMVQGIQLAYAQLKSVTTARKAMIVIGDGTDTDSDKAKAALADLKKRLKTENIQAFAIIYKPREELNERPQVITALIPTAKTVNSKDGIAAALAEIVENMKNRYYVTFKGYDEKAGVSLPWDGKDHDLTIKIDQQELEPYTLQLAPKWSPPKHGGFPWLIVILVVVGLLLLIIIGAKVFSAKPAPQPMPMPMPQMPMAAPAAPPKPAGPMKTVMIGAGGEQDGFPIVGWLVPLNGVDAYKTMRLRTGLTKIGTAPPADLVINDGFMSTEHCQIQCSPAGFILVDNGSTNGCYVNDRKVQKHELIDNDMIMLGKTSFKFKTVN